MRRLTAVLLAVALTGPAMAQDLFPGKTVFGWVEHAFLEGPELELRAKLDTGAKTSSLSAVDIERFERDGEEWVRFDIPIPESDRQIELERPVYRNVLIKDRDGSSNRRPVVRLVTCLGPHKVEAQYSLADRTGFHYPILIGRRVLKDVGLVDASGTFLADPVCEAGTEQ